MKKLANVAKRGCPECKGKRTRECKQCEGKTWMFDWYEDEAGAWTHNPGEAKR
ncbi:MAG: hypothetical protein ACI8WB_000112 [Phenylobacterium sp.]|jgi:hypothetical protein